MLVKIKTVLEAVYLTTLSLFFYQFLFSLPIILYVGFGCGWDCSVYFGYSATVTLLFELLGIILLIVIGIILLSWTPEESESADKPSEEASIEDAFNMQIAINILSSLLRR